jgi:hypothetical protein
VLVCPTSPRDLNLSAREVVKELTHDPDEGEDPKAVRAGRLGSKKGGPARKKALGKKRRSEIT